MPKKIIVTLLCIMLVLSGCGGSDSQLDPNNPVTIEIWNYYGGSLKTSFDELVQEFNATDGRAIGVYVEAISKGNVDALNQQIQDGANNEPGANPLPNMFFAYSDIAYFLAGKDLLVDYNSKLGDSFFEQFIPGFLNEGKILGDKRVFILPFAKSSEVVVVNRTDFDNFCKAVNTQRENPITIDNFATWEGILEAAGAYRGWVAQQSPGSEKALFGVDTISNFIYSTHRQLDLELFTMQDGTGTVHLGSGGFQRIWNTYSVPMINGSFGAFGRYRSDDFKTGDIIAYLGSSSSASYVAETIITGTGATYPIQVEVLPMPVYADGRPVAIQQGAGLAIIKYDEKTEQACAKFAQWLTDPSQNIRFAEQSGYMPVTEKAVLELQEQLSAGSQEQIVQSVLLTALNQVISGYEMYTPPVFTGSYEARSILGRALDDVVQENRAQAVEAISAGTDPVYVYTKYSSLSYLESYLQQITAQLTAQGIAVGE